MLPYPLGVLTDNQLSRKVAQFLQNLLSSAGRKGSDDPASKSFTDLSKAILP
jgi:hypothetical protein